jgi:NOL1/NOP2/fmu family ribosome biogenesis protein
MTNSYDERFDSTPTSSTPWDSSWPALAGEGDRDFLFSYLEDRFGISRTVFDAYWLFRKNKSWWLLHRSPHLGLCAGLKVSRVGIRAFQQIGAYVKPSTRMVQVFAPEATKGRFEIHESQLHRLVAGETVPFEAALENGYVILSMRNHVLGLGLLINGKVRSQIPKSQTHSIREHMDL